MIMENKIITVVLGVSALSLAGCYIYGFINYPTKKKLEKVKEWLFYAVSEAEKTLGGGTGQIKLRYVYDMFLVKFPYMAQVVSFESFSKLVDEALDKFRSLLKNNKDINNYVNGDENNDG